MISPGRGSMYRVERKWPVRFSACPGAMPNRPVSPPVKRPIL